MRCRLPSAALAWCSNPMRCIRTCRWRTTCRSAWLARRQKAEINQRVNQSLRCCSWRTCSIGGRRRCPAGSVSAWRSAARWWPSRTCSCSTNRCPTSTPRCGCRCASRSPVHKRLQRTMIYVTHDQVEAMTLADKIVVLDAGRVAQSASRWNCTTTRPTASSPGLSARRR